MTSPPIDATPDNPVSTTIVGDSPLTTLSNAQVFSRDPEAFTPPDVDLAIARLTKIVQNQRKARQDAEAIASITAKIKKANKAKRSKAVAPPNSVMDTVV